MPVFQNTSQSPTVPFLIQFSAIGLEKKTTTEQGPIVWDPETHGRDWSKVSHQLDKAVATIWRENQQMKIFSSFHFPFTLTLSFSSSFYKSEFQTNKGMLLKQNNWQQLFNDKLHRMNLKCQRNLEQEELKPTGSNVVKKHLIRKVLGARGYSRVVKNGDLTVFQKRNR